MLSLGRSSVYTCSKETRDVKVKLFLTFLGSCDFFPPNGRLRNKKNIGNEF